MCEHFRFLRYRVPPKGKNSKVNNDLTIFFNGHLY